MIILFIFALPLVIIHGDDELLAVTAIYRHGDRPPLHFYPNDPYQDPSFWSAARGELTNIGKLQHFDLGQWLRRRYNGFLSSIYNKSEIYVRSSDMSRCLMSASANLAGLYPPQGKDIWTDELLWQPIPVHTLPRDEDDVIEVSVSCPVYKKLKGKALKSNFFQQLNEKYQNLYKFLTEKSGEKIGDIKSANGLYDILYIESFHNFTLPEWFLEVQPQLIEIGNIYPKLYTFTPQLARLLTGRFFSHVLSQFSNLSTQSITSTSERVSQKFRLFSGHDNLVHGILDSLAVQNLTKIPFAATVIFELRRSDVGTLYVQVIYKTDIDKADVVQVGSCDLKCGLSEFVTTIQPLVLTKNQFDEECH